ncbi:LysR family transcriptional regulator [Pseudomonas putida]|uniref:helix-turn-helix domain-containing protein n=1 Tax=Pseudomonas putida TaxID=303 RepID=UPI0018D85674|nr:LysR family transcriptional regulator [Pseudomonas putida]MBH3391713.1 LysR family transcriptional regulator [Pseudomonas putida]
MVVDADLLHDIDLNSLLAFWLVCHEHSVSRAAERLKITQPAVSNTLAKLRVYFGDPLFFREHNTFIPTKRAQSIADELTPAFRHIQRALGHCQPSS